MKKILPLTLKKSVRSGSSAFVMRFPEKRLLLIERENHPNKGQFCFPGGTHEFGETLQNCAIREVEEETGYKIKPFINLAKGYIPPWIEEINPSNECNIHWIIHCQLYEMIGKYHPLEENLYWEWFSTQKEDKGFRHISELHDSELVPCFYDVYKHFQKFIDK